MTPSTHSSSPREEHEPKTPVEAAAAQAPSPSASLSDDALSGLSAPKADSSTEDPIQKLFKEAMDRMHPGDLYCAFRERIKELQHPVSPDSESKVAEAIAAFREFPIERQVEALNSMLKPERLANRPAWPIASAPQFRVPPPEIEGDLGVHLREIATELLSKGNLPTEFIRRTVKNLYSQVETNGRSVSPGVCGVGTAAFAAVMIAAAPWWVSAPVVGATYLMFRSWLHKTSQHAQYTSGHIAESVDALAQIHVGQPVPILLSLEVLRSEENPQVVGSKAQVDAFLLSRALRVLGRPAMEITGCFAHPRTVSQSGNILVPAVTEALAKHGVSLDVPLVETISQLDKKSQREKVDFLELMNAAHFVWARRDRENLRSEFADIVLAIRDSSGTRSA
jgi:hypothetical protein